MHTSTSEKPLRFIGFGDDIWSTSLMEYTAWQPRAYGFHKAQLLPSFGKRKQIL